MERHSIKYQLQVWLICLWYLSDRLGETTGEKGDLVIILLLLICCLLIINEAFECLLPFEDPAQENDWVFKAA